MKINGAGIICKMLERQGIRVVPGIPGGTVLPLYDALRDSTIEHILTRHEQGAGFIAQGMARAPPDTPPFALARPAPAQPI